MPTLKKLDIIIVVAITLVVGGTFFVSRTLAEQSGGSPDSNTNSLLKDTYNTLVGQGFGSEDGSNGAIWNRIQSASTWVPNGDATEGDVREGKTFFSESSRTLKTGTMPIITCPSGMIPVPEGNGQAPFCVDKYEAKQVGGLATSQASGTPWVSITQYGARNACAAVGKHLITEAEWRAIARDIQGVATNWSNGVVGSAKINDGHSDDAPNTPLAASTDDTLACSGTGQTCSDTVWSSQRRTYKLSNGQYIWDFGGNVWEYTDSFTYDGQPYSNNWSSWASCSTPDATCGNTIATEDRRYGANTTSITALKRGGSYNCWGDAGVFSVHLSELPSNTRTDVGFRCAK